jgi:hypothetical protein
MVNQQANTEVVASAVAAWKAAQVDTAGGPWLSLEDLALRLRLPPATVRKLRHERKAPRGTRMGRSLRFHIDDVILWEGEQREAGR